MPATLIFSRLLQQPLFWLLTLTTTLLISAYFSRWFLPTFAGPTLHVKQIYPPGAFCKGDLAVTPQNPILAGTHSSQVSVKTFSSPLDLWKAATPHTPPAPTRRCQELRLPGQCQILSLCYWDFVLPSLLHMNLNKSGLVQRIFMWLH